MRVLVGIVCAWLICATAFASEQSAQPSAGQTSDLYEVELQNSAKTTARLNLRRGPGTDYPIVSTLPEGHSLILMEAPKGTWLRVAAQIESALRYGWVHKAYVEISPTAEPKTEPEPAEKNKPEEPPATPAEPPVTPVAEPVPAEKNKPEEPLATPVKPVTYAVEKPDLITLDGLKLESASGDKVSLGDLLGSKDIQTFPEAPQNVAMLDGTSPPTSSSASSQDNKKEFHIVMVPWRGITDGERGFMDYLERRNIPVRYTILDCEKDQNRLPGFVEQIKILKPDLVYVFGTTGILGLAGPHDNHPADKYIDDIPIVFNIVSVPVKSGLVPGLESSGRNVTGASHIVPLPIQVKALQSLMKLERLGAAFNPQEKNAVLAVEGLDELGKQEGFEVIEAPFEIGPDDKPNVETIPAVIAKLAAAKPQFIYLPSDSFLVANSKKVIEEINRWKIPSFSATEVPIKKAGALTGLVSRYYNVGQLAGYKAEQILIDKIPPKDIPMETLSRFSFMLNLKTAHLLEFYPPLSVLKFVEVVE